LTAGTDAAVRQGETTMLGDAPARCSLDAAPAPRDRGRSTLRAGSVLAALLAPVLVATPPARAEDAVERLTGKAAMGEWRGDKPGVWRLIRPKDLPRPYATPAAANQAQIRPRPQGAAPKAPPGYKVELWTEGLQRPRTLRTAPNGDIFVAETVANRVTVLRPGADGGHPASTTFASGLDRPFGIAFYPATGEPEWVYVANTNSVVRFPYRSGDTQARGKPETIVASLPTGGHSTRDVVFSPDGRLMLVSVGSRSNVAEGDAPADPAAPGASGGVETERAAVLAFDPQGGGRRIFASGVRNCVGMAVHPITGDVWCSTNERDGLGDDLVPDYLTRVKEGAFYGWPWYYLGKNQDPRHQGAQPGLAGRITVPDVLLQAHSASLGMTFYTGDAFPAEVRGDAFAAEHGSWNRAKRTGYKVVRARLKDGVPTGEYQDFLTGFVIDDRSVWGRPVGVTVDRQGALLVSEDAGGTIWRVTWTGKNAP
jgi:glucose/arabinose dehydrogenase